MAQPEVILRFTDSDEAEAFKEGARATIDPQHGEHNAKIPGDRRMDDTTSDFGPQALTLERGRNADRVKLEIRATRSDHDEADLGSVIFNDLGVIKLKLLAKLRPFATFVPTAPRCCDGLLKRREKSGFEGPPIRRSSLACRDHVAQAA